VLAATNTIPTQVGQSEKSSGRGLLTPYPLPLKCESEDIGKLVDQVRAVTQTTKEIEGKISSDGTSRLVSHCFCWFHICLARRRASSK